MGPPTRISPSFSIVAAAALVASAAAAATMGHASTAAAFVDPALLPEKRGMIIAEIRSSPPTTTVASSAGSSVLSAIRRAVVVAGDDEPPALLLDRRSALVGGAAAAASLSLFAPLPVLADDGAASTSSAAEPYERRGKDFAWSFVPPTGFEPGNKPLKTHLDEVNFSSSKEGIRGYQYGITVDPVRIDSLRQFGTPEEVAARVVTAEVNRDGIFEVTLAKDPVEDDEASGGSYVFEYVSDGKRGKKRFVTKIFVRGQKLYVLTAQSKEEEYDRGREGEMAEVVKSFRLL